MCIFCRSLFVLLYFFFWPSSVLLRYNDSDTPLVSLNSSYRFMDTKSWEIYSCHRWLVAHYDISIFQLLARYNYKHYAPLIQIVLIIDFWKFKTCTLHGPGDTYLSKCLISISFLRGIKDDVVRFYFVFSTLIYYCFEYSDCYFCTVLCNRYLQLSYTYKLCYHSYRIKEWLIIIISYICFFIRVCFTFCNNVKVTFLTFGGHFS